MVVRNLTVTGGEFRSQPQDAPKCAVGSSMCDEVPRIHDASCRPCFWKLSLRAYFDLICVSNGIDLHGYPSIQSMLWVIIVSYGI